jgi:hypothetical protein
VARNKAAAELAQVKNENPLPLRRAKITQDAALRKVEKDGKAAEVGGKREEREGEEREKERGERREEREEREERKGGKGIKDVD